MIVLLAGASGLVGSLTLESLIQDDEIKTIILLNRSNVRCSHQKVIQVDVDFFDLTHLDLGQFGIESIDAALCALGSTIKKAGNKENFKNIDFNFVINFAIYSKKLGAKKFAVVSALGANPHSFVFYNKVKGLMEEALKKINFETLTIIRPSLLLGERKELRPAELIFIKISPFLNLALLGPLKKFKGIDARIVAINLSNSVKTKIIGLHIIENQQML